MAPTPVLCLGKSHGWILGEAWSMGHEVEYDRVTSLFHHRHVLEKAMATQLKWFLVCKPRDGGAMGSAPWGRNSGLSQ